MTNWRQLGEYLSLLTREYDVDFAGLLVRARAGPGYRLMRGEGPALPTGWQVEEPVIVKPAAALAATPKVITDSELTAILRGERLTLSSALTVPMRYRGCRVWLIAGRQALSSMLATTTMLGRLEELEHVLEVEHMRREAHLHHDLNRGVGRLFRALQAGAGEPAILHAIVTTMRELAGTDAAYVSLPLGAGSDSEIFRMAAFANVRTAAFRGLNVKYGEGLGGLARARGRPVLVLDYSADRRLRNAPVDITLREGFLVAASAPLRVEKETIGCLYVANRGRQQLSDYDVELLRRFAPYAASALQAVQTEKWRQDIVRAQEREQLAYQLHDTVMRSLIDIALQADAGLDDPDNAAEWFATVGRSARETIDILRVALSGVRWQAVASKSLSALAVELQAGKPLRRITRDVRVVGIDHEVPARIADCLLAVGREAITNAELHSGSDEVCVELEGQEKQLHMIVKDFGHGFSQLDAHRPYHYGLAGMHWRVAEVGGRLWFEKPTAGGFAVHVTVPV